ncbi:DUF998 domain-containing protein [Pseudonocardia sp. GCM10023141]|uniref:DUF998 domain-containing protein n=1 Tax=Pseudonocardia sp. GCM10023141 TaxID=3252653 RepID=UPI00360E7AF0
MTTTVATPSTTTASTRLLLACAVATTPVFVIVGLAQAFTREGFDLLRHPLSQLSTGDLGWIQITNFLVTAALTIAGSFGFGRVLRGTPGGTWVPRLLLVNGIGTALAGVFVMDPGNGFPAGNDAVPATMSWHSTLHMVCGSLAFLAMITACFVLGRHYSRAGRPGIAAATRLAGIVFIAGDAWAMAGGALGTVTMFAGVLAGMACISAVAAEQLSRR